MGKDSAIEWTHHTFNPWWGCARVSPGCERCYAETFAQRLGLKVWGAQSDRRFFEDRHWAEPPKWNKAAEKAGERHRVFCASMADVFEDRRDLDAQRARLFALIHATPHLDWLLLTKRPENMERLADAAWMLGWPRNVWAGCTVEDQKRADERIPYLLKVPARVRFLSCEPLLGRVLLDNGSTSWLTCNGGHRCNGGDGCLSACEGGPCFHGIDWVICGGESGHGTRPMHADWARLLRDQCVAAGVAFHFKQWGQHTDAGSLVRKKHDAGRLLDGCEWSEFPTVGGVQ